MVTKRKTADEAHESATETQNSAPGVPERQPGDESENQPQRKLAADPFGIASDNLAGVHLAESRRYRQSQLAFDEKPPQAVIDKLKDNGFRWNSQNKLWVRPIEDAAARQDRIDAERLFQEVAGMLREAKGLGEDQGKAPF